MQEAARREKRRLLDAQRGRCRVRLGSHLDEWCALKDHLGFSLHSQLAKFLLDSYRTTTNPGTPVPKAIPLLSVSVPSLHRLAFLCHQHGRSCHSPPTILGQPNSTEAPETPVLLWGCKDHQFHWDPHDNSLELDGNVAEKGGADLSSLQQSRTTGQEKVPKSTGENRMSPLRADIGPDSTAVEEGLSEKQAAIDPSHNTCSDHVSSQPEPSNDARRVTQGISDERPHVAPGSDQPLKTNGSEQLSVTVEGLSQTIALETPDPSIEVGNTEAEDTGSGHVEVFEDTQESISADTAKEKPEAPISGRPCRHPRTRNQLSPSYQQALMSDRKVALSFPCRRSPRSSKGSRAKAGGKDQVSQAMAQCTSAVGASSDGQDQEAEVLLESTPNTDPSKRISHIQESLTEDIARLKTPSENFDSVEDQEASPLAEPSGEGIQTSRAAREEEQDTQTEAQEPQGSQCRGQKTSRRKSLVDEELAQICKKRIRKATPQELLMCEYDDCGKIFSKRQYLNYHQKYQHMNQRTFRCSVTECGKTFNFKKHLKEHEKRHSDRRDFICEFCARAFRSSSNLIIHRRIHTGEKPLQCEFCGFTCRQKASLNWHMKKHDADSFYKFPCDICGQRFEKRDNLAAHKSRKHPAPRETEPQGTPSACPAEAKDDHTETLPRAPDQEVAPAAPEGVKETLFPEYLDLSESVQDVSQQSAQTPGNPSISLVIVL